MIILNKINLSFGKQIVFNNISHNINQTNRIGLVGRNGSGKSTLLKIIAGQQTLDEGEVSIQKGATIGYMPQEVVLQSNKSVYEEALCANTELQALLKEEKELEEKLHANMQDEGSQEILEKYSQVHERLIELDAANIKTKTKKILTGLGFGPERLDEPVSNLSVGWRMRIVLAKLLLQNADFYLFDEPTNHLDIVTKDWFLHFLQNAPFGFMIVCHDRYFLDHLCDKVLELELGRGTIYHGNYTYYTEQKEQRSQVQEQAAIKQQKGIEQKLKLAERFKAKASKAKMAQSILKKVEKIERIETAPKARTMSFSFPPVERSGKVVLRAEDVSHSFDDKKIFSNVSFEVERGERVAIVAPNGVGKTTLFNLITGRLELKNGRIENGYNVETALFEQDQDKVLTYENTILQEVESSCTNNEALGLVRKFLGGFLFSGDDVKKKIRVLSGGEKNRVAMTKVLLQGSNVLLLDEPTNHLDIQSKEVLLSALQQYKGTIVFVSHDRDFLDKLATRIFELSATGIVSYQGNYESYLYHKHKEEREKQDKKDKKEKIKNKDKNKKSNKEQYELRRKINKLEGKIERLEEKIPKLNASLEQHEYGTQEFTKIYEEVGKAQKDLDVTVAEWESLQD